MRQQNSLAALLAIAAVLFIGLACSSLMKQNGNTTTSNGAPPTANTAGNTKTADADTKTTSSKVEKADFTVSSEELDAEFIKKGVKKEDLEKYANKNIAVTGRVNLLVLEKSGSVEPWVSLVGSSFGHTVNCYFDDENVEQMKTLKRDKVVKVQGFQDDFIVPGISPMLKHCVVLEGAN